MRTKDFHFSEEKQQKKMKKEMAIQKIQAVLADVSANWRASDGGLTMAASDMLTFGQSVLEDIEEGNAAGIWKEDPFRRDATETEIISIAQQWAKGKIRRRVEDRLRKDDHFFEKVVDCHLGVDCCSHCGQFFGRCGQYPASFPAETGDLCFGCAAHFHKEKFLDYIKTPLFN